MDIWNAGPFGNEAAMGFAREVVEDGAVALREALEVVLDPDSDYVEAEEGARAVAAAQILASALSGDTEALTDAALRAWVAGQNAADLAPLRGLAHEAIERILGPNSELPELWEEAEGDGWLGEVRRLQAALG